MGNKLYAEHVLTALETGGQITIAELADHFDVSPETVRSRLRELRDDGEPIIHNNAGLLLVNREMIETDIEVADIFRAFVDWVFNSIKGITVCAKPNQKLLPALKRSLKESMVKDERKALSTSCLRIKMLVDSVDIDDDA